jgi:uncharacterized DUF497 family protein
MPDRLDPAKDAANRAKHGLPLSFGDEVFADESHLVIPTIRVEDGEERYRAIGMVGGKLYTAVFVWRDGVPRFISVRRSNHGEERAYRASGGPG